MLLTLVDLQPKTIYDRFLKEFPDVLDPLPVLRWLDGDEDWIEIRQGSQKTNLAQPLSVPSTMDNYCIAIDLVRG